MNSQVKLRHHHDRRKGNALCGTTETPLINAPLQRGDRPAGAVRNRFNGFDSLRKTVETVLRSPATRSTPLKRGVSERRFLPPSKGVSPSPALASLKARDCIPRLKPNLGA